MKAFKPPSMVNRPVQPASPLPRGGPPPAKKRRVSDDEGQDTMRTADVPRKGLPAQRFHTPAVRKPLAPVTNTSPQPGPRPDDVNRSYYNVLWRKFTTKKNKTWDGDGILTVVGTYVTLHDVSGKEMGKAVCKGPLLVGSELSIGGKEVEVESMLSKEDYTSGRVFLGNVKSGPSPSLKEVDGVSRLPAKAQAKFTKLVTAQKEGTVTSMRSIKPDRPAFRAPLLKNTVQAPVRDATVPVPRHSPTAAGALVMKRPQIPPKGRQLVDVVVDPLLTRHLREHQREGVAFLYECVMGLRDYDGEGAVLADEMGLGKTLQTIALLWTLLKQNPIYEAPPIIKKALIVCPVSLIKNWRNEFRKWLGNERIGVFVADDNKMRLTDFTKGRSYHVMIIGYEKLTKVKDQLQGINGIDIVICDEGHRLKTASNKAAGAIKSLSTERRVILSGTPIQNDLSEFHTMVDFVNPNILSKYSTFKREFETPILKSRQPGALSKDVEKGEARSAELAELTAKFILRRTAELLHKYLPPKTEYVVFCRPTSTQKTVYRTIVGSEAFTAAINAKAVVLELIMILKKVCNCPSLLLQQGDKSEEVKRSDLFELVPQKLLRSPGASGKLQVLDSLLHQIMETTDEKVVVVSNYTSTLDVLGRLLASLSMSYLRLDGTTPQGKRQSIVDVFNRCPQKKAFVLLLSAKAGGTGLNLIGASRLVMFDLDWNPATDLQAMARVHRDGQRRPCFIYRLVTQGALDEKIFQRQVSKTGLADSIVDGKSAASGFTQAELRDLFTLDEDEGCQTHKLLGCDCGGKGLPVAEPALSEDGSDAALPEEEEIEVVDLAKDSDDDCDDDGNGFMFDTRDSMTAREIGEKIQRELETGRKASRSAKMLSLMQYTHFDTSLVRANPSTEPVQSGEDDGEEVGEISEIDYLEIAVEDAALQSVIREPGHRIGFVLAKLSS